MEIKELKSAAASTVEMKDEELAAAPTVEMVEEVAAAPEVEMVEEEDETRAIVGELRPQVMEVLQAPDFKNSDAVFREQTKFLRDLYREIAAESYVNRRRDFCLLHIFRPMPISVLHEMFKTYEMQDIVNLGLLNKELQWTTLWKSTPYLNLVICRWEGLSQEHIKEKFREMIRAVLSSRDRDATIIRFHFNPEDAFDTNEVAKWMKKVLGQLKVLEVELKLFKHEKGEVYELPNSITSCTSLLCLKLLLRNYVFKHVKIPNSSFGFTFKHLKELYLERVYIHDKESIPNLLSECLVIELLDLRVCKCEKMEVLHISSASLKSFKYDYKLTHWDVEDFKLDNCGITLSCPNLRSFIYKGGGWRKFVIDDISSLEHISLDINHEKESILKCFEILVNINNIEGLALNGHFIQYPNVQKTVDIYPHEFSQLKSLKFSDVAIGGPEIQGILILLELMPNLESVGIVIKENYELSVEDEGWEPPKPSPLWKRCLKRFELENFKGILREFDLVRFILEHEEAMKELKIIWSRKVNRTSVMNERLMDYRKAASTVNVTIIN